MGDGTYAWLVELGKTGIRHALHGDEITIGRGTGSEIRLNDPKVSRSHARVVYTRGRVIIEDLKSAHGVLVNGKKIEETQLTDGDQIQLGDTFFILEFVQDSIGTIMVPPDAQALDQSLCRYCESPIPEGEAYCSTCGSLVRKIPEPFEFIQQAYLQLRALRQSGKMDATTFRSELEKMVVSDGSGGYWMVGVQSGRWHWFNGSEWIQRDPPTTSLKQVPLVDAQPPPYPPPVPPPPEPGKVDAKEGQRTRRLFLIGGGTLAAFSILAIGAYAAYQLITQDEETAATQPDIIPQPIHTIAEHEPTQTVVETVIVAPNSTSTLTPELPPTETLSLPYSLRPYDPVIDENLSNLADFAAYLDTESNPEHAIYKGTWYVQQPAMFSIGWCAIDETTRDQNLEILQMSLEIDGQSVEPGLMFEETFADSELACTSSRIVLEFLEAGEHRLRWTTTYPEPINDGWETYEAGTYLNEYVLEVRNLTAIEDEFNESSGKWDEGVQGNFSLWTEAGNFHIQVHKENFSAWSIYHDLSVSDVLIIAKAKRISEINGAYGLIARYQDVSNFYYFIVDDTGYFTIGKRLAGDYIDLMGWTASEFILTGDELNRLGITFNGNEIAAFVNSQVVGTVTDESFQEGPVGMIAQSIPEAGEMHAVFDVFYFEHYD